MSNIKYSINVIFGNELKVFNIQQKDNSIKDKFYSVTVQDKDKSIENNKHYVLKNDYFHNLIFINILDNTPSTFSFNELIDILNKGCEYFEKLDVSIKIKNRINAWVKNLGKYSYMWTELLDKPNYGLEIFESRFWPFFNVNSKDWKNISINALKSSYPNQQDCLDKDNTNGKIIDDILKDYKKEYDISQKYNNFLGYSVMNPESYPDMDSIISKLQILKKLNLHLLMFEAILRLMITPTTCHIIKESSLWELVNPLINNLQFGSLYKNIFMHFMYYAMYILNHEDIVMFSKIHRNYRIIFTHNEALNMPQTYKMHMNLDPYIQQLTGETYLVQSIPYYLRCKRYIQPIKTFERRFFLATGGALANIPLHKFKASVSGSILIPCLTYSELENDFKNIRYDTKRTISNQIHFNDNLYKFCDKTTHIEKDFISFLEYYYPSYNSLHDNDFIDQVLTQSPEIIKSTDINEEKKEPEFKPKYNLLSDIDISITSDNYETFDEIVQILSKQIKENCKHIGEVWIKKIYTAATFKYKIYGPGLIRPIDLFRVPYNPEKMVKKFHCPIVRSWYDGSNITDNNKLSINKQIIAKYWKNKLSISFSIYTKNNEIPSSVVYQNKQNHYESNNYIGVNILRSCLASALCGLNNDYKWFFNSKPCVEVILKYAQRGISTIINEKEKKALIEYMKISPRWKFFINKDIDIMGLMSKNHIFFNPCVVNGGIRYKLRMFKKSHVKSVYNKKQHVGLPITKTNYDSDFVVKTNSKVYHPDINKINMFINHIEQMCQDEFSDGDDF
jgi:hypothetical protein